VKLRYCSVRIDQAIVDDIVVQGTCDGSYCLRSIDIHLGCIVARPSSTPKFPRNLIDACTIPGRIGAFLSRQFCRRRDIVVAVGVGGPIPGRDGLVEVQVSSFPVAGIRSSHGAACFPCRLARGSCSPPQLKTSAGTRWCNVPVLFLPTICCCGAMPYLHKYYGRMIMILERDIHAHGSEAPKRLNPQP
jgi:hypothetical protein